MKFLLFILFIGCAGCSASDGKPLAVADVVFNKPLPGMSMSAGYLTLSNESNRPILITSVASPQFGRVEMHESTTEDNVSRMKKIDELRIDAGQSIRFEPGGKHLMLMQATEPLNTITLNFYSAESLLLSVNASASEY